MDSDEALYARVKQGDIRAFDELYARYAGRLFGFLRPQVPTRADAEDVLHEALLATLESGEVAFDRGSFRTWLYRIAVNHVLNMKRRSAERTVTTFADYRAAIDRTPDLDLPDPNSVPVALPLLVEEAKNGCTMGMLLCLDRKQRLIFTLGAILGASDAVGGEVLEMSADNFRQCLSRARRDLHSFMNGQCGLVNQDNPCRCPKKTRGFIEAGHVDPHHLLFVPQHVERVRDVAPAAVRAIEDVVEGQHADLYRDHPFLQPADKVMWLRRVLESEGLRNSLHLS